MLAGVDLQLVGRTEPCTRIARDLVARISELTVAIDTLARQIGKRTDAIAPTLLLLVGCGPLTAAKIVAETAGIGRFRSRAAFAAHNGTAPVPVWSGNLVRHRLNRGGNRQLNVALHRIAVTQLRCPGLGQAYVAKRQAAGIPRPRLSGHCAAVSATRFSADCRPTRRLESASKALRERLLDTGARHSRCYRLRAGFPPSGQAEGHRRPTINYRCREEPGPGERLGQVGLESLVGRADG